MRYNALRKTSAISAQDADERNSDADAKAAAAEAARASVRRSEELQAFQKVLVAPLLMGWSRCAIRMSGNS